ncbi:MAG: 5-oxoprolinase subunit PxpA [Planctomycetota bacterium]|nr:5-oxoprolinase subunit PxpA [Planctomycetota bacterium]
MRVDLNGDVGEGAGHDADLLPLVTSANIACGGHAGDEASMRATVALAAKHGVAIGAHPSYPDRANFGRVDVEVAPAPLKEQVAEQILALRRVADHAGLPLRHVKPHGALYNRAARDEPVARAVIEAVQAAAPGAVLFVLAGSPLAEWARSAGLAVAEEVFADRGYRADGSLVPRGQPGAHVPAGREAGARVLRMLRDGTVASVEGKAVPIRADTICIHGDGPEAVRMARELRAFLVSPGGVEIARFGSE